MSRTLNQRCRRWTRLTLAAAAFRGAIGGVTRAIVDKLLDLI
jgi:hypothetical protein